MIKQRLINIIYIIAVSLFSSIYAYAQDAIPGGFRYTQDNFIKEVTAVDNRTIHVRLYPQGQIQARSLVINDSVNTFSEYSVDTQENFIYLKTNRLCTAFNVKTGNITFYNATEKHIPILAELQNSFIPVSFLNDPAYTISQTFNISADEALYGLGQFQEGIFNYRNHSANLVHANREIANPVLLSTNNYLIYWDNYSKTRFTDNEAGTTFWSEVGDGINYYFVYGEDMKDAISGFRDLTGHAPMMPKSAFGFWMSKERYKSFDELTSVVAEYRKRKIPLDNIVQDWQYWGQDLALWNSLEFHPENFANPKDVIDKLHNQYNVKLTLSVWPCAGPKTAIYKDLEKAGALFDIPTWAGYKVIDIYNPKARELYWNYLYKGLYTKGVDSWWMDATEPSFRDGLYQDKQEEWSKKAGQTYIGSFHRYLNTYSLIMSRMMYNNLRKESNKRVSLLTRSAFAGQQKYATSTWSGDIYASWDVFKKQIPAGLNLCMTGIPYWTTDIGAFRVISSDNSGDRGSGELSESDESTSGSNDGGYKEGLADPAYLELYTRWFQYGAFNPMFRAHGTEVPREIWHFGEPGTPFYDAQIKMIDLRYSLLSYIYSSSWNVTAKGGTMMRALAMDFTDDKNVYNIADSYMLGDALLVAPVTHPMYYDRGGELPIKNTTVEIYLPKHKGIYWYDIYNGKQYKGGQTIKYDAPLDKIPLFAKGGSIIPRNNIVQYVSVDDNKAMDFIIYPGKDSEFTLYEDDNETYNYENGQYSTIRLKWDEQNKKLSIDDRKGKFEGMHDTREFNIYIVKNNKTEKVETITYRGKAFNLSL